MPTYEASMPNYEAVITSLFLLIFVLSIVAYFVTKGPIEFDSSDIGQNVKVLSVEENEVIKIQNLIYPEGKQFVIPEKNRDEILPDNSYKVKVSPLYEIYLSKNT